MAIDFLDDFVPEGLEPGDLGEAVSHKDGGIHLISLYESRLTRRQVNGYVVLVTDGSSIDRYNWTIERLEGEITKPWKSNRELSTTRCGRIHWRPEYEGTYKISVNLVGNSTERTLEMLQKVRGTNPDLEKLREVHDDRMVPAGNIPIMRRLLYDNLPYLKAAANAGEGITVRMLSSLMYSAALHLSTPFLSESLTLSKGKLGRGSAREMTKWSLSKLVKATRRRGICRLNPVIFAYQAYRIDILKNLEDKKLTLRSLENAYHIGLDIGKKKIIANRLRFPKQNILIAAEYLRLLLSDWAAKSAVDNNFLSPDDVEIDEFLETLGTLYKAGDLAFAKTHDIDGLVSFRSNFGAQFSSSYDLPAIRVLVVPSQDIKAKKKNEWEIYPNIHKDFKGGFVQYVWLAPFYRNQYRELLGDKNLAQWVNDNIVSILFPPPPYKDSMEVSVHRDLKVPLERVALSLPDEHIKKMSGFVPRMIGKSSTLSNHAKGKAVDFDHPTNPELERLHLTVLKRWFPIAPIIVDGRKRSYSELASLNASFMDWFPHVYPAYQELNLKPNAVFLKFKKCYNAGGIMTLSKQLVDCMETNDFHWGGYWRAKLDFMHFDYEPPGE